MKKPLLIIITTLAALTATAQTDGPLTRRLGTHDYRTDTAAVGRLDLDVDALAFFKDNEFDGHVLRGYSLPGFRLQPRITFTPLQQIRLEAGFHATVYDGTNKYPSYAFHDIATWKGNKYQPGAHVLPFFRATASLGPAPNAASRRSRTTIVLGDIYGGQVHGLVQPLYSPELSLTDDPEMGTQIIVDRPRWHSDLWLNWQSYIFEEDTHQEAFTVGWTQRVELGRRPDPDSHRHHRIGLNLQVVAQHRGGEQDITTLGTQTLANAAAGLDYEWRPTHPAAITAVTAEAYGLMALQQSGHLWPFNLGAALWASTSVEFIRDLRVSLGAFHAPRHFCSLFGSPYFGTLSLKHTGHTFATMTAGYWGVEYGRTFTVPARRDGRQRPFIGSFTVGGKLDGYVSACGTMTPRTDTPVEAPQTIAAHVRAPFSFGIYFRATPSFVLKRWNLQ